MMRRVTEQMMIAKISMFLLSSVALLALSGCQSQSSVDQFLAIEVTPTQVPFVNMPSPTPLPTPTPQVETRGAHNTDNSFPYEKVENIGKAELGKLSGIVFNPKRETLFAVNDKGWIIEISPHGTVIQTREIQEKADFEGIAYSPVTERLYVAVEGEEVILEVNPATLEAERIMPIDRIFEGNTLLSPKGKGIEGITYVPGDDPTTDGSFYLVNQSKKLEGADPSIVFEVEISYAAGEAQARIIRYFSVGVTDLSGIHYVPSSRRFHIISDGSNLLLEVSLAGQVLEIYPLPGKKQEGITIDGAGNLYIAQDGKTALVRFTSLDSSKTIP